MNSILSKIESIIFVLIVFIVLILNIYGSIFMLASYWACFDKNKVLMFILSLIIFIGVLSLYKRVNINKKRYLVITITLSLLSLTIRLILNRSFSAYPTGDQYQTILAINDIFNKGLYGSLNRGGT